MCVAIIELIETFIFAVSAKLRYQAVQVHPKTLFCCVLRSEVFLYWFEVVLFETVVKIRQWTETHLNLKCCCGLYPSNPVHMGSENKVV